MYETNLLKKSTSLWTLNFKFLLWQTEEKCNFWFVFMCCQILCGFSPMIIHEWVPREVNQFDSTWIFISKHILQSLAFSNFLIFSLIFFFFFVFSQRFVVNLLMGMDGRSRKPKKKKTKNHYQKLEISFRKIFHIFNRRFIFLPLLCFDVKKKKKKKFHPVWTILIREWTEEIFCVI